MNSVNTLQLTLIELSKATDLSSEILIEIVEEDILEPSGSAPDDWLFSIQTVSVAKKATRLHRDLDIDWPGIALALSLIEEMEQLRRDNQKLKRRLQRFTSIADDYF